ncbi:unnamed protein product [Pipistrellus nathusii]|uniref:Spermatogenic leucine zipper protein 1 n=1 Tax=Pipistrellus nathusii TaxID=59473 RepID=A0ABP0A501_PIPNA
MEVPCLSRSPKTSPKLNRDALGPKTVIALLEVESLRPASWSSCSSLPKSCLRETKTQTTKKCEKLLKDIKESLHNMKRCEKKVAKAKESSEGAEIEEELSELREKVRGLDRINRTLLKRLLFNEQSAKKRMMMMMLDNQSSDDTGEGLARDVVSPSEEGRAVKETQLSKDEAEPGSHPGEEKSTKLQSSMEQILREAEHWSVQHAELSELMKLYQKFQHDLRARSESKGIRFQTPPQNAWANYELETQMRKLNHNTHSLHVITALLENECQIMRHRVALLKELHRQRDAAALRRTRDRKAERCKQSMPNTQVTFQIRDRFYKNPDSCRKKKARNNRVSSCLAKALRRKKRSVSRLR